MADTITITVSEFDKLADLMQEITNELRKISSSARAIKSKTAEKPFKNLKIGVPQEFIDNGTVVPLSRFLDAVR